MKVKNDHRSKFSNLRNWREEAWKISGLQRDSNPWPPRNQCDQLSCEATHKERGQFVEVISPRAVKWCEIYLKGRYELNKLTSLPMCGFTAKLVEHRTGFAEVTGSNSVEALIFFRLRPSNCLNWKIYCDDHSSLSDFALSLTLKWRLRWTRKWPIRRPRRHNLPADAGPVHRQLLHYVHS